MYLSSSSTIRLGVSASIERDSVRGVMLIASAQNLNRHPVVGKHADLRGQAERLACDLLGRQAAVLQEGAGGGQGIRPAGADRRNPVVGLHDISAPGQQEDMLLVGDDHQ